MRKTTLKLQLFIISLGIGSISVAQTQEENTFPYPHYEDVGIGFPITTNGSGSLNYKLTAASRLFKYSYFNDDLGQDIHVEETIPFRILAESYDDMHEERTEFLFEARVFPYGEDWENNDRVYSMQQSGALLVGVNSNSTTNYGFSYSIVSDNSIYSQDKVLVENRIGIGTTNPASSLDITNGDVTLNDNRLKLRAAASSTNYLQYQANFQSASLQGPVLMGANGGVLGTTTSGTKAVLSWKSSGRVGINQNSPTADFEVNGTVKFDKAGIADDEIQFENWSGFHRIAFNSLHFHEWGQGDYFVLNDGKVGIGTQTPALALDINGLTTINSNKLFLKDANTNSKNYLKYHGSYYSDPIDGVVLSGESGGALGSNQGGVLYWKSDGRVGIGTFTPHTDTKLDIRGNVALNDDSIYLRSGGDHNHYLAYSGSFNGQGIDGPALVGYGGGFLGTTLGGDKGILYWKHDNKVGINTDNPTYSLEVSGNAYMSEGIESGGAIGPGNHAFLSNYSDFNGAQENINWFNSKTPKFVNLLGTNNEHAGFGIADGQGIHSPILWMWNSGNGDNALRVKTMDYQSGINSGTDLLVVNEDGKVGINLSNPTEELEVEGTVKSNVNDVDDALVVENNSTGLVDFKVKGDGRVFAREVEVKLGTFPDYVFEDDYNLLSLDELRAHIETQKHLPGVKSAEKVKDEGIGLGELSKLQMEKIEELTLYILQLEERIKKLEASEEVD